MERKSLWKNLLLLTFVSLLFLHVNVSNAADDTSDTQSGSDSSESCVLEQE